MYRPTDSNYSVVLASGETSSWILRYMSKLQDRISSLLYVSSDKVEDISLSSWAQNHIARQKGHSAIQIAVDSTDSTEALSVASCETVFFNAIRSMNSTPIIVVDENTDKASLSLIKSLNREYVVLIHSANSVHLSVADRTGRLIYGRPITTEMLPVEEDLNSIILTSSLIFIIINKIIAGEIIMSNEFKINVKDMSITSSK